MVQELELCNVKITKGELKMSSKRTMYNETPLIVLQGKKAILQFGRSKAQLILEHIDDIRLFVEDNVKKEVK